MFETQIEAADAKKIYFKKSKISAETTLIEWSHQKEVRKGLKTKSFINQLAINLMCDEDIDYLIEKFNSM
jgi:hypothetical protein